MYYTDNMEEKTGKVDRRRGPQPVAKFIKRSMRAGSKASLVDAGYECGKLVVHRLYDESVAVTQPFGKRIWVCKCACGFWICVSTEKLVEKKRKSCGCLAVKAAEDQARRYQARAEYLKTKQQTWAASKALEEKFG